MMNDDSRFPLSPMQDNILVHSEPPPASLEFRVAFKGENAEGIASHALSRTESLFSMEGSRSPFSRTQGGGDASTRTGLPSGEALDGEESPKTDDDCHSDSPTYAPDVSLSDNDNALEEIKDHAAHVVTVDKDAESAIHALLSLQRDPSPTTPRSPRTRGSSPEPFGRQPLSPNPGRQSAIQKFAGAEVSRYFCKFPRCGKAYASTDAVRKHCRQRHLDWLRRLGHGCPALYCRWED